MSEKKSLKQEAAQEGAPIWIISFADMMSLLMSFMVAMLSMSELRQGKKLQEAVKSFQNALGYAGGGWLSKGSPPDSLSFEERVRQLSEALKNKRLQLQKGTSNEQGIQGDHASVKTIREGLQFTIGGRVSFEPGKAKLLSQAQKELDLLADVVRGLNNKIRITGHTANIPPELYQPFPNLDDLAFARASAVKEYLIHKGIRPERMSVESCGASEPIRTQAYDPAQRALNDRVSIIVMEALVEEFQGEPALESGDDLDG
jgi:chemotaxis protein MotB